MFDISIDSNSSNLVFKDVNDVMDIIENLTSLKAEVGILETAPKRDDGKSNAEIGRAHEYGKGHVPKRSFLRLPFADGTFDTLFNQKKLDLTKDLLKDVAEVVLDAVKQEFESNNGHGAWPPITDETYRRRRKNMNRDEILRDTEQLYRALDMRVIKK